MEITIGIKTNQLFNTTTLLDKKKKPQIPIMSKQSLTSCTIKGTHSWAQNWIAKKIMWCTDGVGQSYKQWGTQPLTR
jgi:hypothetical protein